MVRVQLQHLKVVIDRYGSIPRLSWGRDGRPFRHSGDASGPESSFLCLLSGSKALDSGQIPAGMTSVTSVPPTSHSEQYKEGMLPIVIDSL
jgi:hypothetical protein